MADNSVRPTKKQREILGYIEQFIAEHGYSPSYREVMNGLDYNSVATVSLHINSLIRRGHLRKRDHSARSLEVVSSTTGVEPVSELEGKVAAVFSTGPAEDKRTVIDGLKILGYPELAAKYESKLEADGLPRPAL